jgi:SAM-dependent methyltransferase
MTTTAGVRLIVRLNWPWYAAGVAALLAGALTLGFVRPATPWSALVLAVVAGLGAWLLASVLVSHLVYDRSPLSRGAWLEGLDLAAVRSVAVLHAGQDEASAIVATRLAHAVRTTFDFHDPVRTGSASLRRARALAAPRDPALVAGLLPLDDGSQDLVLLVFAAHELRDDADRAELLREAARTLAPGGRVVVVEHLRDAWNLLAYGPGAFHFLPRTAWLRGFGEAGLRLVRETTCTRFVHVFTLEARP